MKKESSATGNEESFPDFSKCHAGIIAQFERLALFPDLFNTAHAEKEIRASAADMRWFFREVVYEHHEEEEEELFPLVLQHAQGEDEQAKVASVVERLIREHRELELLWESFEPQMKQLSRGNLAIPDHEVIKQLASRYLAHARYEEAAFLPLSARILGRKSGELAALGLTLHARHEVSSIRGYI